MSAGDYQRLCQLLQVKAALERTKRKVAASPSPAAAAAAGSAGTASRKAPKEPAPTLAPELPAASDAEALPPREVMDAAAASALERMATLRGATAGRAGGPRPASAPNSGSRLARARQNAARHNDAYTVNRLRTPEGAAAFLRKHRMQQYSIVQRRHNGIADRPVPQAEEPQTEIATQTDHTQTEELSEWSKTMLARDEESLEHLAEADLAYLEMVRTKATATSETAGALATSEAEQALADSWQELIVLRLKSQKLQLRAEAQPMSPAEMQRVEGELTSETQRIASRLQQQLQQLTSNPPTRRSPPPAAASHSHHSGGSSSKQTRQDLLRRYKGVPRSRPSRGPRSH